MSKLYIDPPVPFKISVNLKDQKKFIIKGRAFNEAKRFNFNLQKVPLSDAENVTFHIDVRFKFMNENHVIVTNYKTRGQWGSETIISNFPFSEKEQFTLEVLVKDDMYTVEVNGHEITRFLHQLPIQLVDAFTIEGDVILSDVQVM